MGASKVGREEAHEKTREASCLMADQKSLVLSVAQAAELLGCSRGLCYQLVREGKLPGAIRLSKKRIIISRARLEAWLNGNGEVLTDGK